MKNFQKMFEIESFKHVFVLHEKTFPTAQVKFFFIFASDRLRKITDHKLENIEF